MFLSEKDLQELTGAKHRGKQIRVLRSMGYQFQQRPTDGRILVLAEQVRERQLTRVARKAEPNYSALAGRS